MTINECRLPNTTPETNAIAVPRRNYPQEIMSSGSGEETYLESFMENLNTLPHDLRRTLDLLKDLDDAADLSTLVEMHKTYLESVEEKILQLEVVKDKKKNGEEILGVRALKDDGSFSDRVVIPTTNELFVYTYSDSYPEIRRRQVSFIWVCFLWFGKSDAFKKLTHNCLVQQKSCLEKADEKVAVAQQAYEMIDAQIQRLDTDMKAMEKILQVRYHFHLSRLGWVRFALTIIYLFRQWENTTLLWSPTNLLVVTWQHAK